MRLVSFLYMFHPCHRRKRSAGGMEEGSKQMGFVLRNSFLVVALVLFLAVAVAAVPTGAVMAAANAYNGSFSMQGHPVEEEWALDSETSRRILQSNNQHISYRGLKQGMPAATPAASGLSYVRGCKKIYGCRGSY
ncbi:putative protein RALF-like 31 [Cocos nucifera]|uniref:Uncharacterized protein n=1 Tax=Cocos nucifera TaxID=13894 RepID=A0A8K0ICG3_COCNU|nr:putative protein RALF-like 31 [Cocos nucifera]